MSNDKSRNNRAKRPAIATKSEKLGSTARDKDKKAWRSPTDQDFILSSEVGRLAQQLALRHGDRAGGLSDQHGVVEPHPSRRWGDQVSTLSEQKDGRQGAKLGEKRRNGPMKISNFPNPPSPVRPLNTARIRSLGLHTAAAKCDFTL